MAYGEPHDVAGQPPAGGSKLWLQSTEGEQTF